MRKFVRYWLWCSVSTFTVVTLAPAPQADIQRGYKPAARMKR
jgi:hypothetical protein